MSKMKHLLRKLHIGGYHHHHRIAANARPLVDPPTPQPAEAEAEAASSSLALERTGVVDSAENSVDFNFFEEEFQVQLALAISVSDAREDPETLQIKAAKQISLGRSPSETLVDSIALQYWV